MLPIFRRCLSDCLTEALAKIAGALKATQMSHLFDGIGAVFEKALGLGYAYATQILHDSNASLRLVGTTECETVHPEFIGNVVERQRFGITLLKQTKHTHRQRIRRGENGGEQLGYIGISRRGAGEQGAFSVGMREQMRSFAGLASLGNFLGMLTDSRSFLSYPRHEYFRRIFCDLVGNWVENGEYPCDENALRELVEGVSFANAKRYFDL